MYPIHDLEKNKCWNAAKTMVSDLHQITKTESLREHAEIRENLLRKSLELLNLLSVAVLPGNRRRSLRNLRLAVNLLSELEGLWVTCRDLGLFTPTRLHGFRRQLDRVSYELYEYYQERKRSLHAGFLLIQF